MKLPNSRFKKRPLSHSQLSSFEYDQEQWFKTYVLGEKFDPNPAMLFGSKVGDSLGTKGSMVPELTKRPGGAKGKEYELRANLEDIYLVGYIDQYCPDTFHLEEDKTSDNPNRWDQKKVDRHPQLDMYALLLYLQDRVIPEDLSMVLNFIPVERGGDMIYKMPDEIVVHRFETHRTTQNIIDYTRYILDTVSKMKDYAATK